MSEGLPALGNPTSATSATVLSSRTTSRDSPGSPSRAKPGALRRGDASAALPRPPLPPRATTQRVPMPTRSVMVSPVASSRTTVPSGTGTTMSSPSAPSRIEPWPGLPLPALRCGCRCRSSSVVTLPSTTSVTSPPRPPLPPSGPPSGLNFSRCTEAQPWPPLPPATCSTARSTKVAAMQVSRGRRVETASGGLRLARDDRDDAAAAQVTELDGAGGGREQRVVAASADVEAGVEVGAALANENLAGVDDLAAEPLHTEPLRVGVTPVAGGRCALLVCHGGLLPGLYAGDPQRAERLTVALPLVVAGLVAELVNDDLGALAVLDDLGGDPRCAELGGVGGHGALVVDEQDRGERDRLARSGGEAVDLQRVADGDAVLVAAGADDRVHGGAPRHILMGLLRLPDERRGGSNRAARSGYSTLFGQMVRTGHGFPVRDRPGW